ncbi:MAG: winged helix-turn-helix domain-containing protein [Bacteroidales bacterium]|nr:winged helix-turn-helix domain-containing protein [Bacteroidales bacterium]
MNIISILNEATSQLYGRFYCLSRKQSHGRVADVLLCLSERVYASPQFHLGLSRSDLADLTGLTSESVIRILKEFKDEGIIESRAKDISIIDMPALQRISQLG